MIFLIFLLTFSTREVSAQQLDHAQIELSRVQTELLQTQARAQLLQSRLITARRSNRDSPALDEVEVAYQQEYLRAIELQQLYNELLQSRGDRN